MREYWKTYYKPSDLELPSLPPEKKRKESADDLLYSHMKSKQDKRDELKRYLDEPPVAKNSEAMKDGPLNWWKVLLVINFHNCKKIYRFAHKLL